MIKDVNYLLNTWKSKKKASKKITRYGHLEKILGPKNLGSKKRKTNCWKLKYLVFAFEVHAMWHEWAGGALTVAIYHWGGYCMVVNG